MAAPAKPPFALHFFPSLTDFAFLFPAVLVFAVGHGATGLLRDSDTGWHIRAGQWILEHGTVPRQDPFSFTKPGAPWFAFEWLWDVITAGAYRWGGLPGVVLLSLATISLTSALLFRLVRRRCENDFIAFAVTLCAVALCALHWLARPHLASVLFFVLCLGILDRLHERFSRLWLALPLLCLVWANLHGGFLAAFVLIGSYAAGDLLRGIVEPDAAARAAAFKRGGRFLLAGAACALATLVNPYGYRLHAHLWELARSPLQKALILEWEPFHFDTPGAILFEIMMLLGMAAAFRSLCRKEFTPLLLFALWCHEALRSVRHLELFACVAAPLIASALDEWTRQLAQAPVAGSLRALAVKFRAAGSEFRKADIVWRLPLLSVAALVAIAALLRAPAPPPAFRAEFDAHQFPVRAVDRLGKSVLARRVFSSDAWGGYLIYRLYPDIRVFFDGRSDFYGGAFVQAYIRTVQARAGWDRHLAGYGVDAILLPVDLPLAGVLKESPRWELVYDDGTAIAFLARAR